jgi:hypothetical protein
MANKQLPRKIDAHTIRFAPDQELFHLKLHFQAQTLYWLLLIPRFCILIFRSSFQANKVLQLLRAFIVS